VKGAISFVRNIRYARASQDEGRGPDVGSRGE